MDWSVSMSVGEQVHAQADTNSAASTAGTSPIDTMSVWEILNLVLKVMYLLLWPLLVIAWLALDNTLVYASIFDLDAPLWQFWNMMKNFANFTLWFMVLFAIIKSILTNSWGWSVKDEKSPLGIIKTTLIAGILIQASWFLLAALIDVSTIATYAVGGLPLSVLKDTDMGKQKILSVNSSIDLNKFDLLNKKWDFSVWYSTTYNWKLLKISECNVMYSYVIWRKDWDPKFRNVEKFEGDPQYQSYEVCVLNGSKLVMRKEDEFMDAILALVPNGNGDTTPDWKNSKWWYNAMIDKLTTHTWWQNDHTTSTWVLSEILNLGTWSVVWIAMWKSLFDASDSVTIGTLIKKSKWFVWPLVTIYASLLNFTQLTDDSTASIWETSGIFIIKTAIAIALFFPLIALALVLIARIGILRLYIVASPFIVLKESFKDFIKMEWLDEYLSIKAVIGIVFAPVVTVAALSISLIFMTALVNGFKSPDTSAALHESIGIQQIDAPEWRDAVNVMEMTEIEFSKLPWWEAMDWFSWLIVNFFAIGLMWMVVFAAIKANALGKKIGQGVQNFWSNMFQTLPILPIGAGGQWVGVGSMSNVIGRVPDTYVRDLNRTQEAHVSEWLWQWPTDTTIPTRISTDQGKSFIKIGASQEDIKTWVQKLWVESTNVGAVLSGSTSALYDIVSKLPDTTPQKEKDALIAQIALASGLKDDWFSVAETANKTTAAKTALDTFVWTKTIKNTAEIEGFFNTATWTDKANIQTYFTAAKWGTYIQTIGDKTYTVTQIQDPTTKTNFTYTATEIPKIK